MSDSEIQNTATWQELEAQKKQARAEFLKLPPSVAQAMLDRQIPASLFKPDLSKDFTSHALSIVDD